jgi:tetraacyldisaccharide 4'-kinase
MTFLFLRQKDGRTTFFDSQYLSTNLSLKIYHYLLPFAWLYSGIAAFRNYLYDRAIKKSIRFDRPVIGVGNLTVGGTGKTPMVEYLIRLLKNDFRTATLSRGYGRKTRGFLLADETSTPETLGDEPFQMYQKFKAEVAVSVCEERAVGIPWLLTHHPETQVILLDDAFQHRPVRPGFQILLTDYNRLFYEDFLLPAGRLRESRHGAKRADVIVVTKCPASLADAEKEAITQNICRYSRAEVPVFFSRIRYGNPVSGGRKPLPDFQKKVLLVSGIARPEPLERFVSENFSLQQHLIYHDHHTYTPADADHIEKEFKTSQSGFVLTTEKDFVKLAPLLSYLPLCFLPIETELSENKEAFDRMILEAVR